MRPIVFVVLPGTLLLDLAGPAEAFRLANQHAARLGQPAPYALRFVGPSHQVQSSVGATLAALEPLPDSLLAHSTVVLLGQPSGGQSALQRPLPAQWVATRRWLAQRVAPRLAAAAPDLRLMTVCAGALLAADAGLLAGRDCTTHHEMLEPLQALAPTAQVLANRVFVVDGPVFSSAGITAGIDLALHLIAADGGEARAAAVAQVMVVYLRRSSRDPELSPLLAGRHHLHPAVHRVQDAVCARPERAWSTGEMAAVGHVTPRHLARLFVRHVGRTPHDYLRGIRLALAETAMAGGVTRAVALEQAGIASDRQWRRLRGAATQGAQGVPTNK